MEDDSFLAEVELLLKKSLGDLEGMEALHVICQKHAGEQVYIPSQTASYRKKRDEAIRARFRGDNSFELETSYRLSPTRIYEIVNSGG